MLHNSLCFEHFCYAVIILWRITRSLVILQHEVYHELSSDNSRENFPKNTYTPTPSKAREHAKNEVHMKYPRIHSHNPYRYLTSRDSAI